MTLILHRNRRRCNEEKLRGELLHQRYFSHGCGFLGSFAIAKLPGTPGGTFQSIPLRANAAGIEQFTKVNLDIRAAAPQESPDIVILAGHSRLQQQPRGEEITRTHFLSGMPVKTKDLQLPSFDLPAARA